MKRMISFYKRNYGLTIYSVLVITIIYGYRIINPTIGVDTETAIAAYTETINCFFGNGRFFCAILRMIIMPYGFNYYLALVLAIVFLVLTVLVLIYAFKKYGLDNSMSAIIFVSVFVSFPIFAEVFYFANQCDIIAISMLLSTIAAMLICDFAFYQTRIINVVLGIILAALSAGCYQAIFYFFISEIVAFSVIKVIFSHDELDIQYWTYALKLILSIAVSAFIYFALSFAARAKLFQYEMKYLGINPAEYIAESVLWNYYPFGECVKRIWDYALETMRIDNPFGGHSCYILLILNIIFLLFEGIRKRSKKYIYAVLLVMVLAITPFLGTLVKGSEISIREQFSLPFVFAFCLALFCDFLKNRRGLNKLFVILCLYMSWCQTLTMVNLFHTDSQRYEYDKYTIREIINDVQANYGSIDDKVIVYSGIRKWTIPEAALSGDLIGYSILEWDGSCAWGANYRINYFSKSLALSKNIPTMEQIEHGYRLAEDLSIWPAQGSMDMDGNVIVVKLSE